MSVTPKDFGRAIRRALSSPRGGPGIVVSQHGDNDVISLGRDFRRQPAFPAKITASATDSTNRWTYSFVEVVKKTAGYGGWSTRTGGRTGTARNMFEDMNNGAGIEGNGINVDGTDFPAGFAVQPVPAGTIVMVYRVLEASAGAQEFWFDFVNAVDGECDSALTDDMILPASVFCIWAEENAALGAGENEWAFGNGADTPADGGITLAVNCELFRMTATIKAGTASIAASKNGTNVATLACTAGANNNTVGPVIFSAGDVLQFQTKAAASTSLPNTVAAWFRTT